MNQVGFTPYVWRNYQGLVRGTKTFRMSQRYSIRCAWFDYCAERSVVYGEFATVVWNGADAPPVPAWPANFRRLTSHEATLERVIARLSDRPFEGPLQWMPQTDELHTATYHTDTHVPVGRLELPDIYTFYREGGWRWRTVKLGQKWQKKRWLNPAPDDRPAKTHENRPFWMGAGVRLPRDRRKHL